MVRQDKITYLITYFAAENEEFNKLSKETWLNSFLSKNKLKSNSSLGALVNKDNADNIDDIQSMVYCNEKFISEDINFSINDKVESIFNEYKSILNEKLGHIQK